MWGIPPGVKKEEILYIIKKIEALKLAVKEVREDDRDKLLSDLKTDLPPATSMTVSSVKEAGLPLNLPSRIFWLKKEVLLSDEMDLDLVLKLLSFKYSYENQFGFNNMGGRAEMHSHSSELRELLWDFFTLRGDRMMDISTYKNPITLSIRYRENKLEKSNDLALYYLDQFNATYSELKEIVESHFLQKKKTAG
jgi:hypothetical protein